jgi:cell division protein FtsW
MFKNLYEKLEVWKINKSIFFCSLSLVLIGAIAFFSAAMGILNRNEIKFYGMIQSQIYAYIIGFAVMFIFFVINYKYINKLTVYFYLMAAVLSFLVFVPGLGVSHGGSTRWINIAGFSLQPGELLKIAVIFMGAWYIKKYDKYLNNFKYVMLGFAFIMLPIAVAMFLQKDLGTLIIIGSILLSMFFNSKIKVKHILIIVFSGILVLSLYIFTNTYVKNRIYDYIGKGVNSKGISYQNDQALLAIGNGGFSGRGYGQSIQKFHYLPEPAGDSVFAVFAEEFGFIGSVIVVGLFFYLVITLVLISVKENNIFVKNVIIGGATLIFLQTLLNIGSMLKIIPLSGDTLPFFSQGGTALICNFLLIGIMLQLTKKNL